MAASVNDLWRWRFIARHNSEQLSVLFCARRITRLHLEFGSAREQALKRFDLARCQQTQCLNPCLFTRNDLLPMAQL